MGENFLGEIRAFTGANPPVGWLVCNGATLSITSYQALFTLMGNAFGGDGVTTFAIPDLRGAAILGIGKNLSDPQGINHAMGEASRVETALVRVTNMPLHTHSAQFTPSTQVAPPALNVTVANVVGTETSPSGKVLAQTVAANGTAANTYLAPSTQTTTLNGVSVVLSNGTATPATNPVMTQDTGGGAPFKIVPPYQVVNYIIATMGYYPSQP